MADISKIKLPNGSEYNIKDPISYNKVISRGEQLVINGSGMLGTNTNWSNWVFDGSHANSSAGSFTRSSTSYANIGSDEFFPVNASEKYKFEFDLISENSTGTMYAYLSFYDVDKRSISASNTMYYSGTLTTLARELKAGDTKVYLTDASAYRTYGAGTHLRALIFWDYTNSFGYQYPPETYSRNTLMPAWTDDSSIDKTNNIITLTTPYTGVTHPAGTYVSQGCSGGTYKYSGITGQTVPTEWAHYTGYFYGIDYSGLNKEATFPPGTAYCKVGFLWDHNSANDHFWLTNVSVKEVLSDFIGTDGTAAGTHGLVPAPATTDSGKFLSADGTWAEPPGSGSSISYVLKSENTYTTTLSSETTIPIGIQSYASTDVLLVDINGLDLIQGTDYTISDTNIVLTTPITTSGTKVHFTALKMTAATTSDYATLKGEKGDDGHSPVVTASKSGTTTTVYVDGSSIASINDGTDGTHTISYTPIVTGGAQIGTITIDNTNYPLYAPAVVWG